MSLEEYIFLEEKQPSEELVRSIDYAKDLVSGETIESVVITAIDMSDGSNVADSILQADEQIQDGDQTESKVTLTIKGGTHLSEYKITFKATTSVPQVIEAEIYLTVKEL